MKHYSDIAAADEARQESSSGCVLFLDLAGPLRLTDAHGSDLTPAMRKAQGLLALIGTAPGLRRSRTWLQDKLWSDRDPSQGAASLRQCLHRLRATMGKHADCLQTGSGWIALDPARIRVHTPDALEGDEDIEFIEGIDLEDPEFEDWLRDQRMFYSERSFRAATSLDNLADTLPTEHRESAATCGQERIGVMVAAAALAGYLMQGRPSPGSSERPAWNDLLEALRGRNVARAREIVRMLSLCIH